jgi:uncharacterized membrane protein YgcG
MSTRAPAASDVGGGAGVQAFAAAKALTGEIKSQGDAADTTARSMGKLIDTLDEFESREKAISEAAKAFHAERVRQNPELAGLLQHEMSDRASAAAVSRRFAEAEAEGGSHAHGGTLSLGGAPSQGGSLAGGAGARSWRR